MLFYNRISLRTVSYHGHGNTESPLRKPLAVSIFPRSLRVRVLSSVTSASCVCIARRSEISKPLRPDHSRCSFDDNSSGTPRQQNGNRSSSSIVLAASLSWRRCVSLDGVTVGSPAFVSRGVPVAVVGPANNYTAGEHRDVPPSSCLDYAAEGPSLLRRAPFSHRLLSCIRLRFDLFLRNVCSYYITSVPRRRIALKLVLSPSR